MNNQDKAYIGDSVYVAHDGHGNLTLTTENGAGPSNEIVLEPEVYYALNLYVAGLIEKSKKGGS